MALLEMNNAEVKYMNVILVLKGISLEIDEGGTGGLAGQQRGRQNYHAQSHFRVACDRGRQGNRWSY